MFPICHGYTVRHGLRFSLLMSGEITCSDNHVKSYIYQELQQDKLCKRRQSVFVEVQFINFSPLF